MFLPKDHVAFDIDRKSLGVWTDIEHLQWGFAQGRNAENCDSMGGPCRGSGWDIFTSESILIYSARYAEAKGRVLTKERLRPRGRQRGFSEFQYSLAKYARLVPKDSVTSSTLSLQITANRSRSSSSLPQRAGRQDLLLSGSYQQRGSIRIFLEIVPSADIIGASDHSVIQQ